MTLGEELVDAVDATAKSLGTTRSGFAREAFGAALASAEEREKERKHREGYLRTPPKRGEFQAWESEQAWGEP